MTTAKNTIHHNTLKKAEKAGVELRDISNDDWGRRFTAKWKDSVFIAFDVQEALAAAMLARMLKLEYNVDFVQRIVKKQPVGYEAVGIAKFEQIPSLADIVDQIVKFEADRRVTDLVGSAPESDGEAISKPARAPRPVKPRAEKKPLRDASELDDEALDEEEDSEDERPSSDIINPKYRELYASRGNPMHCGDWLALTLENQFTNGNGKFDRNLFIDFLEMNGVNTAKPWAVSTTHGWQGRLRMTARLALEFQLAKTGVLIMTPRDKRTVPADFLEFLRKKHQNRLDD
jgi:hypothetical protein